MCSINEQLVEEVSFLQRRVWKLEDELRIKSALNDAYLKEIAYYKELYESRENR